MKSQEIRPGMALNIDGQVWLVVSISHVKPGKGPAYTQAKLKSLMSGSNIEKRFRSGEDIEQVNLDRREVEYLYTDADGAVFMDCETFDQMNISADILGDALLYVKPNTAINGLFFNGNAMTVELPASVDLEVTDTPPGIKNATATNQLKEAVCETGLKTRVPPFINNGQLIRVSTKTGEYQSKV
jgi:elongation factor P